MSKAYRADASPSDVTFIDFLLDETGSMGSCANQTKTGFNEFVASQREAEGYCFLTLAKFDSSGIRVPYENLDVNLVPNLSFYPGAATNLYDCIGLRLKQAIEQKREGKSLFVVLTDGDDNSSREYNLEKVKSLVQEASDHNITVIYMGPKNNAYDIGTKMGIQEGNIFPFNTSEMSKSMETLTVATRAFRAGETSGTFFS